MGLDLWFRADVARILQATDQAMQDTAREGSVDPAYRRGFQSALRAVATAFGLTAVGATDPLPEFYGRIPPIATMGRTFGPERVMLYDEDGSGHIREAIMPNGQREIPPGEIAVVVDAQDG